MSDRLYPTAAEFKRAARHGRQILTALHPLCFIARRLPKLPLKVGIHDDIAARHPDLDAKMIRAALIDYTAGASYLTGFAPGTPRIDLDGKPAGAVGIEDALHAVRKLASRTGIPASEIASRVQRQAAE